MVFTCEDCGYEFSRRYNLHSHIKSKHEENSEQKLLMSDPPKLKSVVTKVSGYQPVGEPDHGEEDMESEDSDESGTDSEEDGYTSDDSESDIESERGDEVDDQGETDADPEIRETMATVMYICCQRPEKRQEMLKKMDEGTVNAISECCKRVLKGDIPINYTEKDILSEHKEVMRSLRDPKRDLKEKKEIIVQNGGNFLLSLIPTVVGALAAMFQ
jgi:hypothetical protein